MNAIGFLTYILPGIAALALFNGFQLIGILRKFPSLAVARILIGYFFLTLWVTSTIAVVVLEEKGIVMLEKSAPYVMLFFILTIQMLIYANYPITPKLSTFVQIALGLGWVAAGMMLAQMIFPEAVFVAPVALNGVYTPRAHISMVIISAFRGTIFLYLLLQTAKRTLMGQENSTILFPYAGLITGFMGFVLFFVPRFVPNPDFALAIYVASRVIMWRQESWLSSQQSCSSKA